MIDKEFGPLKEILVAPVSRSAIVFGKAASGTAVSTLQAALTALSSADACLQKLSVALKEHDVADTQHAATAELGKAEALKDKRPAPSSVSAASARRSTARSTSSRPRCR